METLEIIISLRLKSETMSPAKPPFPPKIKENKNRHLQQAGCACSHLPHVRAPPSPDFRVAAEQDLREQLGRLMETAAQLIQFLLHGEDPLLQLPIGVVPVGAEVAHDHLHLLKTATPSRANCISKTPEAAGHGR